MQKKYLTSTQDMELQKHRSDLYYYENQEPDTIWMQIWNNIKWLQNRRYELLQNALDNTK